MRWLTEKWSNFATFGVLEVKLSKPRVGRNPNQPGSHFAIPATARVKFKSGKIMRQKVAKLSGKLKGDLGMN
jgi:nucleoid DNA-binding protein